MVGLAEKTAKNGRVWAAGYDSCRTLVRYSIPYYTAKRGRASLSGVCLGKKWLGRIFWALADVDEKKTRTFCLKINHEMV